MSTVVAAGPANIKLNKKSFGLKKREEKVEEKRCEGGGEMGYKVKTDGFLGNSANESYFKLQQFFINVKLE